MKPHAPLLTLALVLLLPALALAADAERPDLAALFTQRGLAGCFAVQTPQGTLRVNPRRAAQPFRPASTFKIVNALTAFETGVAPDPTLFMKWDGVAHPDFPAWNRDLTLEEAFRASALWYFVELGKRNGRERLAETMRRLDYGNADASGSDQFWIDGGLRISADQQVRALGRLARGEAGFSARSLALLRQIMLQDQGMGPDGAWKLYGKTGLALRGGGPGDAPVGWFVGWVERGGQVYPFALNAAPAQPGAAFTPAQVMARMEISKNLLRELGVIRGAK
jgi:beta-lactamase class D